MPAKEIGGVPHSSLPGPTSPPSFPPNPEQPHKNDTLENVSQEAGCCCPLGSVINDYIFKPIAKAWHSILSFFCSPDKTQEIPAYITLDNIQEISGKLTSKDQAIPTFIEIIKWALQDPVTFLTTKDEIVNKKTNDCKNFCNLFFNTLVNLIKLNPNKNKQFTPIDGAVLSQDYIEAMNELAAKQTIESCKLKVTLLYLIKASEYVADYPEELKALVPQMKEYCNKPAKAPL